MVNPCIEGSEEDMVHPKRKAREYEEASGHDSLVMIRQRRMSCSQDRELTIRTSNDDAPLS